MKEFKVKTLKLIIIFTIGFSLVLCNSSSDEKKNENKNNNGNNLEVKQNDNENAIKEAKYKKNLVGLWHATPQPVGEMSEHFIFYENGSFIFKYSDYDGEKRILDKSGQWDIIYGNLLILKVTSTTVIEGGEFVISPSSGYGWALSGGKEVKREYSTPLITIYPLSDIEIDNTVPNPVSMKIGGIEHWKLGAKPEDIVK